MGRGFIIVNGGYQVTGNDFEKTSPLRANAEDGSFTSEYEVKGGPTFDVGGGVTLSRRFAVGVGLTRFSRSTTSSLNGSVPHPFFFSRPRTVTGDVRGLTRDALAGLGPRPVTQSVAPRLQLTVFGGPSFFKDDQELVTDFTWVDSYPFDEASFRHCNHPRCGRIVYRLQCRSRCCLLLHTARRHRRHAPVLARQR